MAKYDTIRRWGSYMGTLPYYVDAEVARAESDDAPPTAIYKDRNGRWFTAQEIVDPMLRHKIMGGE
jgi:hypothetical protein